MAFANRAGIFLANIVDSGVAPTGPNDLTTFTAVYRLLAEWNGSEFVDCSHENMTITGYHYIEQKDGQLNKHTIDALKSALGWDGRDLFWLEDSLPSDLEVKVTLEYEHDPVNNVDKLKVKWLNHKDDRGGGGVVKSDADTRTMLNNRLGAKLRAFSGGAPAKTPPPPANSPTIPTHTASATATMPTRTAAKPAGCTREEAYAALVRKAGRDPQGHLHSEWARILDELFPDKSDDEMTPAEWAKVRDEAPKRYKSAAVFKDDDIPF